MKYPEVIIDGECIKQGQQNVLDEAKDLFIEECRDINLYGTKIRIVLEKYCKKEKQGSGIDCDCFKCANDPQACTKECAKNLPPEKQFEYLLRKIDDLEYRIRFFED